MPTLVCPSVCVRVCVRVCAFYGGEAVISQQGVCGRVSVGGGVWCCLSVVWLWLGVDVWWWRDGVGARVVE